MPSNSYSFLSAFVLAILITLALRRLSLRLQLVDVPDHRKRHEGHVPLCGGLAIFNAFVVTDALFGTRAPTLEWSFVAALAILVMSGAADDRWRLGVAIRLVTHFAAAALIVLPGLAYPPHLGGLVEGPLPAALMPVAAAALMVFTVGLVNATNMSDGADGLAGGWVAAALFWLALIARFVGRVDLTFIALLLMAAVTGFLAFNMRHPWRERASVFLGDAGSIALGGALAYLIVELCTGERSVSLLVLLWVAILPLTDMASLVVRRFLAGRSPMSADRWHLHHLVLDLGVPHARGAGLIVLASALCGAVAWTGVRLELSDRVLVAGLAVPVLAHVAFVFFATRRIAALAPAKALGVAGGLKGNR